MTPSSLSISYLLRLPRGISTTTSISGRRVASDMPRDCRVPGTCTSSRAASEGEREVAEPGVPVAPRPLGRPGPLDAGEPGQELLEEHPDLELRQVGAEAEVDAVAEADVGVRVPGDVEAVRPGERPLVPVGRALPDQHLVPRSDRVAPELGGDGGRAALRRRRRRPP